VVTPDFNGLIVESPAEQICADADPAVYKPGILLVATGCADDVD